MSNARQLMIVFVLQVLTAGEIVIAVNLPAASRDLQVAAAAVQPSLHGCARALAGHCR